MTRHQLEAQNEALRELLGNLQAVLNDSLADLDDEGEEDDDEDEEEEGEGDGENDDRKSRARRR